MHLQILVAVVLIAQIAPASVPKAGPAESVEARYARAQLELAQANLKRVQQSNKRVTRSVPSSIVAEYEYDVQVAKARLEQSTAARSGGEFKVWLQRAEADWKGAETAWKAATAANETVPGTFETIDIDRFRLRAEVARLQFDRGQALAGAGHDVQMKWEIDLLNNQVQRLKEESRQSTLSIGVYPFWPW
jgi:hypothetical protein